MDEAMTELQPRQVKFQEKITDKKQKLQEQIADIDRAQELLVKNPDMNELLNILGKHRF